MLNKLFDLQILLYIKLILLKNLFIFIKKLTKNKIIILGNSNNKNSIKLIHDSKDQIRTSLKPFNLLSLNLQYFKQL